MHIELQQQTINLDGSSVGTFEFSGNVRNYTFGLFGFSLFYEWSSSGYESQKDWGITKLSLSLNPSSSGKVITVTPNVTMTNDDKNYATSAFDPMYDGHFLGPSSLGLAIIALVDDLSPTVGAIQSMNEITMESGLAVGHWKENSFGDPSAMNLATSDVFLQGFNIENPRGGWSDVNDVGQLRGFNISATGNNRFDGSIAVTGIATQVVCPPQDNNQVTVGLLGAPSLTKSYVTQTASVTIPAAPGGGGNSNASVTFQFASPIKNWVVVLNGFDIRYGQNNGDRNWCITSLQIGMYDANLSPDGKTLTVSVTGTLSDIAESGDKTNYTGEGTMTLLAIAVPA